ncbi:unnamed protein product [Urochloa humidicola]
MVAVLLNESRCPLLNPGRASVAVRYIWTVYATSPLQPGLEPGGAKLCEIIYERASRRQSDPAGLLLGKGRHASQHEPLPKGTMGA